MEYNVYDGNKRMKIAAGHASDALIYADRDGHRATHADGQDSCAAGSLFKRFVLNQQYTKPFGNWGIEIDWIDLLIGERTEDTTTFHVRGGMLICSHGVAEAGELVPVRFAGYLVLREGNSGPEGDIIPMTDTIYQGLADDLLEAVVSELDRIGCWMLTAEMDRICGEGPGWHEDWEPRR